MNENKSLTKNLTCELPEFPHMLENNISLYGEVKCKGCNFKRMKQKL